MPNLVQKLKEFLGLSYKGNSPPPSRVDNERALFDEVSSHDIKKENKISEKKPVKATLERIIPKEEKGMFDLDESMKKPYEEFSEREMSTERVPGEFLVEMTPELTGKPETYYIGIRVNLMAMYEAEDEYGYPKYYRMASHSDAYINDLSTINFGSSGNNDDAAVARIRRILDQPRFTRTKLLFVNMIEVDATGLPLSKDIEKIAVHDFMRKFKLYF